jgi:enoyl-CoA hydratase
VVQVDFELRGNVGVLTLNRPDALNAISVAMLDELDVHLDAIEADGAVRAVVITGGGEKAFCAGADIGHMREASPMEARDFAGRGHAVLSRIEACERPVIAAVNGYALGGGCEMALACDIRLASENAVFGLPEVSLGIFPGWGGTQRLARTTSLGIAKEIIFTGRRVPADEAHRIGLANHVYPLSELVDKAVEMGEMIASRGPWAVARAKEMVNLSLGGDLKHQLARELETFALAFATKDQREGMAAFFEKRPPEFTGR